VQHVDEHSGKPGYVITFAASAAGRGSCDEKTEFSTTHLGNSEKRAEDGFRRGSAGMTFRFP